MKQGHLSDIRWSGLTVSPEHFAAVRDYASQMLAIVEGRRRSSFFWICIVGGTGTGKSTIFNSLCGKHLSLTGIERPKTKGPIVAIPQGSLLPEGGPFAFADMRTVAASPIEGRAGHLSVVTHHRREPWVVVDSPDIDSVEREHHEMAQQLILMADLVLFTLSEEKYADERLNRVLRSLVLEGKEYLVVVNKTSEVFHADDAKTLLAAQGVSLADNRLVLLPLTSLEDGRFSITTAWKDVERLLRDITVGERWQTIKAREDARLVQKTDTLFKEVAECITREREALQRIEAAVRRLAEKAVYEVLEEHVAAVTMRARAHLQPKMLSLYSRYDVLKKPREAVVRAVERLFAAIGMTPPNRQGEESREEKLRRIAEQIDHSPVFHAVEFLVRETLALFGEQRSTPVAKAMREREIILSREEVTQRLVDGTAQLFEWLEGEFETIMGGLPKVKEIGIYSSFLLWGIFIVGLEVAVGGGLSLAKAALDTVLAPFITKTTVEWFAEKEITRLVRELSERYKREMQTIVLLQRDRFLGCLRTFLAPLDEVRYDVHGTTEERR